MDGELFRSSGLAPHLDSEEPLRADQRFRVHEVVVATSRTRPGHGQHQGALGRARRRQEAVAQKARAAPARHHPLPCGGVAAPCSVRTARPPAQGEPQGQARGLKSSLTARAKDGDVLVSGSGFHGAQDQTFACAQEYGGVPAQEGLWSFDKADQGALKSARNIAGVRIPSPTR